MKISCTDKEKENMIQIMYNSEYCPFDGIENDYRCEPGYCLTCFEQHIEWDVKDGDGDG